MNNQAYQEPLIDIDLDDSNHLDNINLNDTNQDRPKLQVGDVFNDWKSVHIAVEAYAKHQGFVVNKIVQTLIMMTNQLPDAKNTSVGNLV